MHAVRDIGSADDKQLAAIREDTTHLLDSYEQFMGGDLVEALCMWREAAKRQQDRRASGESPAEVKHRVPSSAAGLSGAK